MFVNICCDWLCCVVVLCCAVLCRADCELSDISLLRPHTRRNSAPPSEQRFETVLEAANETEPVTVAVTEDVLEPDRNVEKEVPKPCEGSGGNIVHSDSSDSSQPRTIKIMR